MTHILTYIKENLPNDAFVNLIADLPADKLYAQFGFVPVAPESIGMYYNPKHDLI